MDGSELDGIKWLYVWLALVELRRMGWMKRRHYILIIINEFILSIKASEADDDKNQKSETFKDFTQMDNVCYFISF